MITKAEPGDSNKQLMLPTSDLCPILDLVEFSEHQTQRHSLVERCVFKSILGTSAYGRKGRKSLVNRGRNQAYGVLMIAIDNSQEL